MSDGRVAYDGTTSHGIESGTEVDIVSLSLSVIATGEVDDDPVTISLFELGRRNKSAVRKVRVDGC